MLYFLSVNSHPVWVRVEQPMVGSSPYNFRRASNYCASFTIDSPQGAITHYLSDASGPRYFTTEEAAAAEAFNAAAEQIKRQ